MASNSLGKIIKLTTFGESHGKAIGGVLDGFPSGVKLNFLDIQYQLNRRKPGQSKIVSQRKENDEVEFLSGMLDNITTGTPIGFVIKNINQKSKDYDVYKDIYRPNHADYTYQKKYNIRDFKGGGRSSARETANWVVAGALAKHIIPEIDIKAYVSSVGDIFLKKPYQDLNLNNVDDNEVRCPDDATAKKMIALINSIKKQGDTIGGTITCVIKNVPIGWGEPIFNKLHAELGKAMLSINAVKGFEYGSGFCSTSMKGSQYNDYFNEDGTTKTNLSGGIQGGISNGMDIYFRVAFKPVATLLQNHEVLTKNNKLQEIQGKGRHDACVVPRAVPIVEALSAFVLANFYLMNKNVK